MKAAVILYDGFSSLEFSTLYEPLAKAALNAPGLLQCDICSPSSEAFDGYGLHYYPTRMTTSLQGYDILCVPGGPGASKQSENASFLAWLATAREVQQIIVIGNGALLLAAAGLLNGHEIASPPEAGASLASFGVRPSAQALVLDGPVLSASDIRAALELSQAVARSLTLGMPLRSISGASGAALPPTREATAERKTTETNITVCLNLDGSGKHQIQTGLPFLDHILTQVSVHGLFDLQVNAQGDLQIDPHHTMEDVALTLGLAFQQALGDRTGIVRMASAEVPMDDSLARVTVDFSGRPYCVFQGVWTLPSIGGIPNTLFVHFLESLAQGARCNLHAIIQYGNDDHHKAEALFKALGRAFCAATRLDPRREGLIPSSKGVL